MKKVTKLQFYKLVALIFVGAGIVIFWLEYFKITHWAKF